MENAKASRFKYSKAFSDFTVLVYHNIFGTYNPQYIKEAQHY